MQIELQTRISISKYIGGVKQKVAEEVTDEFLKRHPDWIDRYGDRARTFGIEDAVFHLNFLAGSIESGSVTSFEEYARWTSRMLASRGISAEFVAENLEQIGESLAKLIPSASAEVVKSYVQAGAQACMSAAGESKSPTDSELAPIQRLYLDAILKGQRKPATTIAMEALRAGHSIIDVYADVFQTSQLELGHLWESNQISVAEEHMATAITQFVMSQVYPMIEPAEAVRGRVVITGIEGEMHQIGSNMIADVLEMSGWDVRFLGTNVPTQAVIKAVEEHNADVVGISMTMIFNVPKVTALIEKLREKFGPDSLKIVIGGAGFRHSPSLYNEIGADGFASDLKSISALLDSLLPA